MLRSNTTGPLPLLLESTSGECARRPQHALVRSDPRGLPETGAGLPLLRVSAWTRHLSALPQAGLRRDMFPMSAEMGSRCTPFWQVLPEVLVFCERHRPPGDAAAGGKAGAPAEEPMANGSSRHRHSGNGSTPALTQSCAVAAAVCGRSILPVAVALPPVLAGSAAPHPHPPPPPQTHIHTQTPTHTHAHTHRRTHTRANAHADILLPTQTNSL